jgi:hypothetical protein
MSATKAAPAKAETKNERPPATRQSEPGAASLVQAALGNGVLGMLYGSQLSIQRSCCSSCAGGKLLTRKPQSACFVCVVSG